MLVGMIRPDPDRLRKIMESEASVDRASSSDEVDARTSFDGSLNENLFGDQDIQKALESRNVMDRQGDQEDPSTDDPTPELESDSEDSASDEEAHECAAAKSDDDIVDETVSPSPMKNRTRSKARKVTIPAPIMCSDFEDEERRPRPRKRTHSSPAPLRAGGTSKYFRRNSNQFPSIASKKLAARKGRAGSRGRK